MKQNKLFTHSDMDGDVVNLMTSRAGLFIQVHDRDRGQHQTVYLTNDAAWYLETALKDLRVKRVKEA